MQELLLRLPQVKAKTGFGKSQIYQWVRDGSFPAPHRIGKRCVAWEARAVDAWAYDRIQVSQLERRV